MNGAPDEARFLDRVGGSRAVLRQVARAFVADSPGMVGEIVRAVAARDADALFRAAHKLKGSVAIFPAPSAVEAAARLERLGAEARFRGADEALAALEREIAALRETLAGLASPPASGGAEPPAPEA